MGIVIIQKKSQIGGKGSAGRETDEVSCESDALDLKAPA